MELLGPTWRQRLSYGTCAIALVCTLSVYKSNVSAKPLSADQRHWEAKDATASRCAITAANPELLASRYSDNAVLERPYGVSDVDEVYQGQSIYSAWRQFFRQYQIKDFQGVRQQQRDCQMGTSKVDRSVEAQIQITAKSSRGPSVVLSMSY
jgi:hypothetical protein